MRVVLRGSCVVGLVALCLVGVGPGCGGGGGGGGTAGPEVPPATLPTDQGVVDAVEEIVASSGTPELALASLRAEVERVFDEEASPAAAHDIVHVSVLQALHTPQDVQQYLAAQLSGAGALASAVPGKVGPSGDRAVVSTAAETIVIFVNGIWTDAAKALAHKELLQATIEQHLPCGTEDVRVELFWNPTGIRSPGSVEACSGVPILSPLGLLGLPDFLALAQPHEVDAFDFVGTALEESLQTLCGVAVSEIGGRIEDIWESVRQEIDDKLGKDWSAGEDVDDLYAVVRAWVLADKKVILVAHSQGNYLAQQVMGRLATDTEGDLREHVGVVAVASPARHADGEEYGEYGHVSLEGDFVNGLLTGGLPENAENSLSRKADLCLLNSNCRGIFSFLIHDFAKSYLGHDESAHQIVSKIHAVQASLHQADAMHISASTWDAIIEDETGRTVEPWYTVVGDKATVDGSGTEVPNAPQRHRAFVSFDLGSIPAGSTIVSARLQLRCHVPPAFPGPNDPNPYAPFADLGSLVVDHVSWGSTLQTAHYDSAALAIDGILLTADVLDAGFVEVQLRACDVTCAVQADLDAGRSTSQFRMRFADKDTDRDKYNDWIDFYSASNTGLFVVYE